jgi:hypothetical protein
VRVFVARCVFTTKVFCSSLLKDNNPAGVHYIKILAGAKSGMLTVILAYCKLV